MRRMTVLLGICVLLLSAALGAKAQITIAGDNTGKDMTIDISLRDADLNEVITALFNTTGGKYQVQVSGGVVGRINRLQLTGTPFDKVLDAVLGTEYTYVKQELGTGKYLYRISGGGGTRVPAPVGGAYGVAPAMAPPSSSVAAAGGTGAANTTVPDFLSPVINITTKASGTSGATGSDPSATETSVVRLIRVTYADVEMLAEALGGTSVDLSPDSYSSDGNGGSGGNGGSRNNRNNNNNNYNNNNYNNNNYNNNYNNNNNNNYNNTNSRTRNTNTTSRNRNTNNNAY